MKADVVWDAESRIVTATRGTDVIVLPLNSRTATVNGRIVTLDAPARLIRGRTMVPLRFLSESLGADVEWIAGTRTVEITTSAANTPPPLHAGYTLMTMDSGTVIPFSLDRPLGSNGASVGDKYTATIDTGDSNNYLGLVKGAVLEGHVDVARAKVDDVPGVLGLKFDRIRTPDGQTYLISGTLIGLDPKSVENDNGRLVAKPGAKNDNLKFVGYGAGGGALVAILTNGNLITNAIIGGALGYLYGEIKQDPSKARDVNLKAGTTFGARLTRDFAFQSPVRTDRRPR